jgi:hypothetical protein
MRMKKLLKPLIVSCGAALALWAAVAHSAADAHPAAPAPVAPTDDDVLASFKGGKISVQDLKAAIASKDPNTRRRLATADGRLGLLRELVNYDLLVLEAERRGYRKQPAVIDAKRHAAIEAMLAVDLKADPASIPAADVARELASRRALAEKPGKESRKSVVEGALREELAQQRFEQARKEFAKRLRERYKPEIHTELIHAVTPDPAAHDQPEGFSAAPPDPRAAPRIIESDGI